MLQMDELLQLTVSWIYDYGAIVQYCLQCLVIVQTAYGERTIQSYIRITIDSDELHSVPGQYVTILHW